MAWAQLTLEHLPCEGTPPPGTVGQENAGGMKHVRGNHAELQTPKPRLVLAKEMAVNDSISGVRRKGARIPPAKLKTALINLTGNSKSPRNSAVIKTQLGESNGGAGLDLRDLLQQMLTSGVTSSCGSKNGAQNGTWLVLSAVGLEGGHICQANRRHRFPFE